MITDNTEVIRTLEARITELEAERDRLRNLVKKSQDEVVSFVPMLVELAALREAAQAVSDGHWHERSYLEMRPLIRKLDDAMESSDE